VNQKIKEKLDQYLEFDSSEIFRHCDLARIFGGAIRDILAEKDINDIDILVGSRSLDILRLCLESHGYHHMPQLAPKDLQSVYSDIRVINEPETYVLKNKVVQIITPATGSRKLFQPEQKRNHSVIGDFYVKSFTNLISNVDLSCCGVSWDGTNLYENYPGAVSHAMNHCFEENRKALMYSEKRIIYRLEKMRSRGWTEIRKNEYDTIKRDLKLNFLLDENQNKISYIKEHQTEYLKITITENLGFAGPSGSVFNYNQNTIEDLWDSI